MVDPILISPLFTDFILPFVLVFTLIFAILQKTQLLGEGKKQINAIIGLVVGLILLAFPFARGVVVKLMPFLAVSAVVLLVFMLLYGFIMGKKDGDVLHKGVKITLGIILGLGLITALLWATGWWDQVYDFMFEREGAAQIWINVLLVAVIAGAIASVVATKEKSEE
jgi:hypothetical protein